VAALIRPGARSIETVVGDPTGLSVPEYHPGTREGRAAHASWPEHDGLSLGHREERDGPI
jgi:hypothetical protein